MKVYLPLPRCPAGHKRTPKNTRWYDQKLHKGKYVYRIVRCALCDSAAEKRRHRLKRLRDRSREYAPQPHQAP